MRRRLVQRIALWSCLGLVPGCGGGGSDAGGPGGSGPSRSGGELHLRLAGKVRTSPPSSLVALPFFVEDASGNPVPDLLAGDFTILENDVANSVFESSKRISPDERGFGTYTLLLLDLSDSIRRSGAFPKLLESAESLVDTVLATDGGDVHRLSVWWFDGSASIRSALGTEGFTKDRDALIRAIRNLPPSLDRSTNLYGAVVEGFDVLETALENAPEEIKRGNFVLFTDGRDNAGRVTFPHALATVEKRVPEPGREDERRPFRSFTIGLGGEIDFQVLAAIGRTNSVYAANIHELEDRFATIATRIKDQAKSFYLLEYCSPKRAGSHRLTVEATDDGRVGFLSSAFDAEGFTSSCAVDFVDFSVTSIGGPGSDAATALVLDGGDRRILAGSFTETIALGTSVLETPGGRGAFVARLEARTDPPLRYDWVLPLVGTSGADVRVSDVALLPSDGIEGAVLVAVGSFAGELVLHDRSGAESRRTSAGGRDSFILGIDDSGKIAWQKYLSGAGLCEATSVAAAPGTPRWIAVVGRFSGTMRVDDGPALSSGGGDDAFVVALGGATKLLWTKGFGSAAHDVASAVAMTSDGRAVVAGSIGGSIGPAETPLLASAAYPAAFLAAYQSDETRTWLVSLGDPRGALFREPSAAIDVTLDSGYAYVAGTVQGSAEDPTTTPNGVTLGKKNAFVAKYLIAGELRWSRVFGGPEDDAALAIAVDTNGDVALTGTFQDSADFFGSRFTAQGGSDIWLARLSGSDGHPLFPTAFGGIGTDVGAALAVDSQGDVHVAGSFAETAYFFDASLTSEDAESDIYLLRLR